MPFTKELERRMPTVERCCHQALNAADLRGRIW
jgi:hypothetical protein